jgi:hypothetical protein
VTQLGPLLPHNSELTPEHKSELWWSPRDLDKIKRAAKLIAKGIRTRSYRKSSQTSSYANVVRTLYVDCCKNTTSATNNNHLEQWHSLGHSRRGLEHLSVPIPERQEMNGCVIGHVLHVQHYLNEKQIEDYNTRAQFMREASEYYSKTARVFAATLAAADAMAAFEEHQTPPVVYQVMDMCGDKLLVGGTSACLDEEQHPTKRMSNERRQSWPPKQEPSSPVAVDEPLLHLSFLWA